MYTYGAHERYIHTLSHRDDWFPSHSAYSARSLSVFSLLLWKVLSSLYVSIAFASLPQARFSTISSFRTRPPFPSLPLTSFPHIVLCAIIYRCVSFGDTRREGAGVGGLPIKRFAVGYNISDARPIGPRINVEKMEATEVKKAKHNCITLECHDRSIGSGHTKNAFFSSHRTVMFIL